MNLTQASTGNPRLNDTDITVTLQTAKAQEVKELAKALHEEQDRYGRITMVYKKFIQLASSGEQLRNIRESYAKGSLPHVKYINEIYMGDITFDS